MKQLLLRTSLALLSGVTAALLVLGLMAQLGSTAQIVYAAGPRYVAPGGSDSGNDCANLATPCATIQHAVDVADPGDVIKVAAGVYTGVNSYGGLSQVVYISKSVTLQGGYTPAFTAPSDPEANPTTLDAQGQGRVIYMTGAVALSLEGLRMINGNAANLAGAPWGGDAGGGIYAITAAPILSRNYIAGNTAADGGGMFLYDSRATLFGNTIVSNTANSGGGFILYNSTQLVDGRVTWNSPATVTQNIITGNIASNTGGGAVLFYSDAALTGNIIASNQAQQGAGLYLGPSYPLFSNNQIFKNEAVRGGGLYLVDSQAYFTNDILADNSSQEKGSGLYLQGAQVYGRHLTIASNNGGDGSGIYMTQGPGASASQTLLTNTIIASHTVGITLTAGNSASLESTLWYGNGANWAGSGTITASNNYTGSPAFLDPAGGDYHIGPTSAAIDKGIAAGVVTDIEGEARSGLPDLGADELAALVPAIVVEGGAIWASNSETAISLVNHDLAGAPYTLKLYDGDDTLVQTITSTASGSSQEPIPWVVPEISSLGENRCNTFTPKVCILRSFDKNETLVAEAQVKINRPLIIIMPPPNEGPLYRGQIPSINLVEHTPGKQYLIKIQGLTPLSVTRVFTSPTTDVSGHAPQPLQWLLEEECNLNTGWPDGLYRVTTHPIEQPSRQIAHPTLVMVQTPPQPSLSIAGGNTWYAGSTLEISLHRHWAYTFHYLEFNNERIPTPADDDTVKTDGCGDATVSYTLPLTLTPGSYDLWSFDENGTWQMAKQTITVLPPASLTVDSGQRWFPGATVTFRLSNHLPNTPYQLWLDRNGPQARLLGAVLSDAQGQGSLTYSLPATFPLKSGPGYPVQSYRQPADTLEASSELELILPLAMHKTAPATATAGLPVTYTLRVTNAMPFSLTHLILTDTLPPGASYVTGGTRVGQVISWTLNSLPPGATVTRTFVVTASRSLTNSSYGIRSEEGAWVKGTTPVVTWMEAKEVNEKQLYLPLLVKN